MDPTDPLIRPASRTGGSRDPSVQLLQLSSKKTESEIKIGSTKNVEGQSYPHIGRDHGEQNEPSSTAQTIVEPLLIGVLGRCRRRVDAAHVVEELLSQNASHSAEEPVAHKHSEVK